MNQISAIILLFICGSLQGQESGGHDPYFGQLSLGVRSTVSWFSDSNNTLATGSGAQFRIRASRKLSTEWFADWIVADLDGLGQRRDAHIGESMIIYITNNIGVEHSFTPYLMGGFCGDYTRIKSNLYYDDDTEKYLAQEKERWSFATLLGVGSHYNWTKRLDCSLSFQYILHFGNDLHPELKSNSLNEKFLLIHQEDQGALEGHVFLSFSVNYLFLM